MKIEDIKVRIDQLILMADKVLETRYIDSWGAYVQKEPFFEFRSATLSFLKSTFGSEHIFYKEFNSKAKDSHPADCEQGRGILKAAKQEIDNGWIFTVKV